MTPQGGMKERDWSVTDEWPNVMAARSLKTARQLVSMFRSMDIEEWLEGEHLATTESGRFLAFTVKLMEMINPTSVYCRVFVRNLGTMKSQHKNVEQLWASDGAGIQILRAAMSYKRFLFLLRCIRFDDIDTGAERRKSDKLAAIRSIWDSFVQNCLKSYNTSEFVTIHEMLHPFRGRCSCIQYIPNKPAKYGIKIFALCDSKTFYCSNMEIYIGKQPPGPFAVENKPLDIVKRLVMPIENSNKNLTTDNWAGGNAGLTGIPQS
ncbi:uncharacterized protein LOC129959723 [Argiope bruennichi]|uniref:uncharacterized protein LOC129959723 n=1 Tax=Argiope bruennichi TaxID=94029 RepID=UPI0024941F89|nr:uncharacterized protein LOC129959723 [Argiope bruennichi]